MTEQRDVGTGLMAQIPRWTFDEVRPMGMDGSPWYRYSIPLLRPPDGSASRMIDVGCGSCQMSLIARDLGWEVTVVDAVQKNLDQARTFGFDAHQVDLNFPLPFPDDSFDHAMVIEVIEHIVNAELLIEELGRVVKPGGRVLMTTPNNAFYRRRLRALQGKAPDDEGYHFRFFVKRRLAAVFEKCRFRIEATRSFGFLPIVDVIRLRKLRGVGRTRFYIPPWLESVFADRFVWLLRRDPEMGEARRSC